MVVWQLSQYYSFLINAYLKTWFSFCVKKNNYYQYIFHKQKQTILIYHFRFKFITETKIYFLDNYQDVFKKISTEFCPIKKVDSCEINIESRFWCNLWIIFTFSKVSYFFVDVDMKVYPGFVITGIYMLHVNGIASKLAF